MSAAEVADKLGLQNLKIRTWHIMPTYAISGENLHEGVDWLTKSIIKG
jgi:hypothetical protein